MKEKLFLEAFKKAEQQSGKTTKNGIASHLEKVFEMELNFPTSKATFSRYYEQYFEKRESRDMNPNTDLLDKLAEYLEYDSYEDFVKKNETSEPSDTGLGFIKRPSYAKALKEHKYYIVVIFIFITTCTGFKITGQPWMVWNETEYVKVDFDLEKYDFNQLKPYDAYKFKHFKKVTVKCDSTEFFKPDGTANIWYQKNNKRVLEYFTDLDYHPETGKALKPITDHIIDKYICQKDSTTNIN